MSTMSDAIFWCGILVFAGTVASVVFRSIAIPASAGALLGALAATWMAGGWIGADDADSLGLARSILLAFLCFLLGAEMDLAGVVRGGTAAALGAAASSLAAMILVWGAAALAGITGPGSVILAAAAGGASPTATIALASELRARGETAQRLMIAAPTGLLVSIIAIGAARGSGRYLAGSLALAIGGVCGFLVLLPLSRLSTRGAILACVGGGTVVLAGAGSWAPVGEAGVILASIVAGFVTGNLSRNRDAVRDALRDLSLPATVFLFAIAGAALPAVPWSLIAAALLVAAGRVVALMLAGFLLGRREGIAGAVTLAPIALVAPGLIAAGATQDERILPVLTGAVILTQIAGPIASRWALIRTGAVFTAGDPDAWREAMR